MASRDSCIVSVGEDGMVFQLNVNKKEPARVYENADSSSLTAVAFYRNDGVCFLIPFQSSDNSQF